MEKSFIMYSEDTLPENWEEIVAEGDHTKFAFCFDVHPEKLGLCSTVEHGAETVGKCPEYELEYEENPEINPPNYCMHCFAMGIYGKCEFAIYGSKEQENKS